MFGDMQALEVDQLIFKGKLTGGFFIEAGAYDFQDQSTSLYFELKYNWTGLLVEPCKLKYEIGLQKHRNVTSSPVCLSTKDHPFITKYNPQTDTTIVDKDFNSGPDFQCLPLYSLLLALGNPTVNYMSLDIENHHEKIAYKRIKNDLFVREDIAETAGL